MRHRLEDLGRLAVLIRNILDLEIFEEFPCRNKDFTTWLEELSEEKRDEVLHPIPYRISELQEKLYEMLSIAECRDDLNCQDHE